MSDEMQDGVFEDAADDLIEAASYLQDSLNAGNGVLESKWLGAVMRAHELLLSADALLKARTQGE